MSKNKKNYFTQETEDAVIAYNNSNDPKEKSKIYDEKIHYAFFKLTQNIIHTFKFYHTEVENIEDLQHEIIVFLLEKIHLYNHRRNIHERLSKIIIKEFGEEYKDNFMEFVGEVDKITQEQINGFIAKLNVSGKCLEKIKKLTPPKAYSYFGTIVKRWLILYNDKNYNSKIKSIPISLIEEENFHSYVIEENNSLSDKLSPNDKLSLFIDLYVEYCTKNIYILFPAKVSLETGETNMTDAKIADAILELFRKRENLDIFNKKILYIYIREIIDAKTPKITKIADKLYKIFKKYYYFYLENGYIKFT